MRLSFMRGRLVQSDGFSRDGMHKQEKNDHTLLRAITFTPYTWHFYFLGVKKTQFIVKYNKYFLKALFTNVFY